MAGGDVCGDNRFEIIARAKQAILEGTNIDTSPDEMKVLDNFLFRCWQMDWLDCYDENKKMVEQKHGRWICLEAEIGLYECSECGHKILREKTNYCPNCGCKTEELPKLGRVRG